MNGRGNKMTEKEFPYEEIRNKSGDYFHSYQEAATAAIKEPVSYTHLTLPTIYSV